MEMRVVKVGDTEVEVEYDPDDFKQSGIIWRVFAIAGVVISFFGPWWAIVLAVAGASLLLLSLRVQRQQAMEAAIRRAAWQATYKYEDQRIVGYKGMGD